MLHVYYREDALVKLYPEGTNDHWEILHFIWYQCCCRKKGAIRENFNGYEYTLIRYSFIQLCCKSLVNKSIGKIKEYVNDLDTAILTGDEDVVGFLYRHTVPRGKKSSFRDTWYYIPPRVQTLFRVWTPISTPHDPISVHHTNLLDTPRVLYRKRFIERVLKERGFIHDDRQNCWYGTDKEGHSIAIDDQDVTSEDSIQQQ